VKENVVADPEVTPEATTMVTPEEAAGAGLIMPLTMNLCAEANETVNAVTCIFTIYINSTFSCIANVIIIFQTACADISFTVTALLRKY